MGRVGSVVGARCRVVRLRVGLSSPPPTIRTVLRFLPTHPLRILEDVVALCCKEWQVCMSCPVIMFPV